MMESLLKWTLLQLLIAACFKTGVLQNNHITLTSSLEVVLENRSVFLTCSSTTGALSSSHWNTSFYENQVAQCARTNDNTCFKSHFLNNSALFDCICNDNGTFTVLLKQVGRYQHGSTWNCRNYFETSNAVVINVSVPVKHAILTWSENQPLNENTNVTLTCTTSYCLPSAQIHWYRTYMSSTVEITGRDVEITRKIESAEGNVKKVTEILAYMVNRSVNGWNVYCTATNWRSDEIVLSVIYPPDKPPVIDGLSNGSTYRVIENEKVSLSCSVEGGNPLTKPEWHCERMNNITTKERITNNKTVISCLSWMAKRTDGKTCTCKMGHVLSNVSLYVNIDVLYLPDPPKYFDYLKDSLTSTQVTVFWTKGYGGGLKQTFVLNISQTSQPIKYDYINETENEYMQHTITGLLSGNQYQLSLWATNKLGKSSSQTLTIFTKEPETKTVPSLSAAIAGSVSSLVVLISVLAVAFLLYKRRYKNRKTDNNLGSPFDDGCEVNAHSEGHTPIKHEPVYEGLKPTNERGNVELREQTYDMLKQKQDYSETRDPVYTNLTLCHINTK